MAGRARSRKISVDAINFRDFNDHIVRAPNAFY